MLLNSLQSFWYFQKPHLSDSSGNNFLILGSEFWISYWCEEPTEVGVEGKTVIIWTKWSIDVEKSMKDESIKYSFEYYWQFVAGTEIYSVSVNWNGIEFIYGSISHQIIWLWIKIFMKCYIYITKILIFSNIFSVLINMPKIVQRMNSNVQEHLIEAQTKTLCKSSKEPCTFHTYYMHIFSHLQ